MKHITNSSSVRRIKATYVKRCKTLTIFKDVVHMCDIRRVKATHIKRCDASAAFKHVMHLCETRCVKVSYVKRRKTIAMEQSITDYSSRNLSTLMLF